MKAAINDGEKYIVLEENISLTSSLTVGAGKETSIDLNGKNFNTGAQILNAQGNGKLTVFNGTINSTSNQAVVSIGTSEVKLVNVDVVTSAGTALHAQGSGKIVMDGGSINSTSGFAVSVLETSEVKLANVDVVATGVGINARYSGKLVMEGGSITTTGASSIQMIGNAVAEINGTHITSKVTDNKTYNGIYVGGNAELILNNSTVDCETMSAISIWPDGASKTTIKNTTVSGPMYAFTTNASESQTGQVFNLINSTFNGDTPVLLNVPSTMNVDNCTINGGTRGLVVRGGTANIKDSRINLNFNGKATVLIEARNNYVEEDVTEQFLNDWFVTPEFYTNYGTTRYGGGNTQYWGSGWYTACGALVMGNRATAYQYATNVTLENTKVTATPATLRAVYAYANQGDNLGVTFKYDAASVITGVQTYDSANITVNP